MSNEEIVLKIQENVDNKNELLMMLYNQNLPLIQILIGKYAIRIEYEDALQLAFLALYKACEKYDANKGALFMSIYQFYFLNEIRDYPISSIIIPKNVKQALVKLNNIIKSFDAEYGHEPSIKYISIVMELPECKIEELMQIREILNTSKSLDERISNESDSTYSDTIPDRENDIEANIIDEVELAQLKKDVRECLESLEYGPKTVLIDYYMKDIPVKRIASKMGVSDNVVNSYKSKGINTLRKGENRKILYKYRDRLIAESYSHVGVRTFQRTNTSVTERTAFNMMDMEKDKLVNNA